MGIAQKVTTVRVYLDASSDVIARASEGPGRSPMTLAEYQAAYPAAGVTSIISGAPVAVRAKVENDQHYHRHTSGPGTAIGDYTLVENLDTAKLQTRILVEEERDRRRMVGTFDHLGDTLGTIERDSIKGAEMASDTIPYPIEFPLSGTGGVISIADVAALHALCEDVCAAVAAIDNTASGVIKAVMASTTIAEIEAVADPYIAGN